MCGTELMKCLGFTHCKSSISSLLKWLQRASTSDFRRKVAYTSVAALVYNIWKAKNSVVWQLQVPTTQKVIKGVQADVKCRIHNIMGKKMNCRDRDWFHKL